MTFALEASAELATKSAARITDLLSQVAKLEQQLIKQRAAAASETSAIASNMAQLEEQLKEQKEAVEMTEAKARASSNLVVELEESTNKSEKTERNWASVVLIHIFRFIRIDCQVKMFTFPKMKVFVS